MYLQKNLYVGTRLYIYRFFFYLLYLTIYNWRLPCELRLISIAWCMDTAIIEICEKVYSYTTVHHVHITLTWPYGTSDYSGPCTIVVWPTLYKNTKIKKIKITSQDLEKHLSKIHNTLYILLYNNSLRFFFITVTQL